MMFGLYYRELCARLQAAENWLKRAETACPRRIGAGKRRVGSATASVSSDGRKSVSELLRMRREAFALKIDFHEAVGRIDEVSMLCVLRFYYFNLKVC